MLADTFPVIGKKAYYYILATVKGFIVFKVVLCRLPYKACDLFNNVGVGRVEHIYNFRQAFTRRLRIVQIIVVHVFEITALVLRIFAEIRVDRAVLRIVIRIVVQRIGRFAVADVENVACLNDVIGRTHFHIVRKEIPARHVDAYKIAFIARIFQRRARKIVRAVSFV